MFQIVKPDANINFVGKRYIAITCSILLIIAGIVTIILRGGLNMGIDFAGGTIIHIKFKAPVNIDDIRKALKPVGIESSAIQQIGSKSDNEFLIRSNIQSEAIQSLSHQVQDALAKEFGKGKAEILQVEMVGPKVGRDLRHKALLAIYYSLLFIAIYVSGRFELKWVTSGSIAAILIIGLKLLEALGVGYVYLTIGALVLTLILSWFFQLSYALAAILALVHDVLVTVGVFALLNKEFNLQIVAALLTIIGYSLNDTIIVFDRIRENLRREKKYNFKDLVNRSINQTLSRTILTSGTTLIVLITLFLLGGTVIRDFSFALIIGVMVGTYSSIYIASPLLILYEDFRVRGREEAKIRDRNLAKSKAS